MKVDGHISSIQQHVDGEKVALVSSEIIVDGETTLCVERLRRRRLSQCAELSNLKPLNILVYVKSR